jgi:Bifunctional DNA primase/polymerase, N-terminal
MSDSTAKISHILGLLGPALLLPWPSGSKGGYRRWKHLQLADMNEGSHRAKLERAGNIGVALGKVSNALITIDLDQGSYVDAFLASNPLLKDTLCTRAARGCNIWLRCSGGYPPSQKLRNPSRDEIGEWRGDGFQTIVAGTHPEGMPYQFVVEKPVITISYEAIIWPDSILPPRATESMRVRGIRETEVVGVSVCDASLSLERVGDLISQVAPTGFHQNNASLFKLARLVISYQNAVGRRATEAELEFVFDRWCLAARRFWRHTRDDYWAEFLEACQYARIGLDHDPLQVAVSRAKAARLPDVRGFTDERVRLLAAICQELHTIMGDSPFFLPTRKVGEMLGAHHTLVARALRALEFLQIIHLAPGEVRRRGSKRSPRYLYGPRVQEAESLPVGATSQAQLPALSDSQPRKAA